jgi:hypothetical protein
MEDSKEENLHESNDESSNKIIKHPHLFSKDNQPSGEVKSAGWWKKKKGRQLLRHLLELDFDGEMLDPKTGKKVENTLKRDVAMYMKVPIESVTVEMVLFCKQIALAAQKNDTAAFNTVIDNAYGKPKETFQLFDDKKPEIIFNLEFPKQATDAESAFPPIEEAEESNEREPEETTSESEAGGTSENN